MSEQISECSNRLQSWSRTQRKSYSYKLKRHRETIKNFKPRNDLHSADVVKEARTKLNKLLAQQEVYGDKEQNNSGSKRGILIQSSSIVSLPRGLERMLLPI